MTKITGVHKSTKFYENYLKIFRVILSRGKQTNKQTNRGTDAGGGDDLFGWKSNRGTNGK